MCIVLVGVCSRASGAAGAAGGGREGAGRRGGHCPPRARHLLYTPTPHGRHRSAVSFVPDPLSLYFKPTCLEFVSTVKQNREMKKKKKQTINLTYSLMRSVLFGYRGFRCMLDATFMLNQNTSPPY